MALSESNLDETEEGVSALVRGLSFCNPMIKDNFKAKTKLMKPTVSQLAKQNKAQQMGTSRFLKPLTGKNQKNSGNHSVMEIQAPKRRKLEGGHPCKPKMRITVPRGPDLETAQRAQRLRLVLPGMCRPKAGKEPADMIRTVPTFNARPSNRKEILEHPSSLFPKRTTPQLREFQEFHFKTSERAMQHLTATSSTILPNNSAKVHKFSSNLATECGNREPKRPNPMDYPMQERCESSHIFKALPLNRKILTSKGDIGVFRTTKRETTVPMEFNFHTEKRVHHNLPIDMFNKLSLGSDPQASTGSQLKPSRPKFLLSKGSKENRCDNILKEQEVKEKLAWAGSKQNYCGSVNEANPPCGITRNLRIR
ncbi:non-motor microtubule binding protein [Lithospermum erythrorhizon]|uniref:Non-motor microtubule binding protein n=1 Tax=Lithospermum erythrorhizon TaxID=34254 RepID=A0AAV3QHU3_LITER